MIILAVASIGTLAATIAAWYAMRSYSEQSRPYRIRPLFEPIWTWQEIEQDEATWIEVAGPGSMTSYIIQATIQGITARVSWGIGWRGYRRHRAELKNVSIGLTYPESMREENLGDIGVQRVWLNARGPKPKGMPETVRATFVIEFLDGKKSALTVHAKNGIIRRPRVIIPSDKEAQPPPAS